MHPRIAASLRRIGLARQTRFDAPRPLRSSSNHEDPGAEEADSTYDVVRHASIVGAPRAVDQLAWVVVTQWCFRGGREEWYTEYWDDRCNEGAPEDAHGSMDDAVAHAENLFGGLAWKPGGPPR